MNKQEVIGKLSKLAESTDSIRATVLTSSQANDSSAPKDSFSDYDVVLYVRSLSDFQDDLWLSTFGTILVCWPLTPKPTTPEGGLTRLVLFESRLRIDFQITDTINPPTDYDLGYEVIVDKDGITASFPKATNTQFFIKKPTEKKFLSSINSFFWDATYVPKYLWRGDIFYAKYMYDAELKFKYLEKMIEWLIGSRNNWKVGTNVHGRYFQRYLDNPTWNEIMETFADSGIDNNWKAFYKLFDLYTRFAKEVAESLGYHYPQDQEKRMLRYLKKSQEIPHNQ